MKEKTVATVNCNSPNEDYICSSGGEKLHTEMFVQPKARSASTGVGSCQRRYRIVNFYHSWGGEWDRYAVQLLCRTAADEASTLWSDAEAVDGAEVWDVKLSFWLARQRELTAAYICHSFCSTPVAPVCTRATVFQGSHCWHPRFLCRLKVTPLDCCGSDTLLLPHRFILRLHMLQPPPRHTAVTEPELILNPSAGEPIPAPDGKWGQMKTKCPSCFIHQDSLVKKALHHNVLLNLFHQLQWKQTEADAEQWCSQEGT